MKGRVQIFDYGTIKWTDTDVEISLTSSASVSIRAWKRAIHKAVSNPEHRVWAEMTDKGFPVVGRGVEILGDLYFVYRPLPTSGLQLQGRLVYDHRSKQERLEMAKESMKRLSRHQPVDAHSFARRFMVSVWYLWGDRCQT